MPGNKRYSKEEIKRIVELKDSGKTPAEICEIIKTEFNTVRVPNSINFIFNRAKKEVVDGKENVV